MSKKLFVIACEHGFIADTLNTSPSEARLCAEILTERRWSELFALGFSQTQVRVEANRGNRYYGIFGWMVCNKSGHYIPETLSDDSECSTATAEILRRKCWGELLSDGYEVEKYSFQLEPVDTGKSLDAVWFRTIRHKLAMGKAVVA